MRSLSGAVYITTIAGDGSQSYGGDGGPATSARLNYPQGVVVGASGNIYIADTGNSCIRMVTESTGIITTVAGDGTSGFSGDRDLAISARLSVPRDVAVDASGNVYIADTGNNRIRLVTNTGSSGIINTVAGDGSYGDSGDGGLATLAGLKSPRGVAVDASGNIYIADTGSYRIRVVTKSNGIITNVAGVGSYGFSGDGGLATLARLGNPFGVTLDASGNIYIADTGVSSIRLVTKSNGFISTVAGKGEYGDSGDGGLATLARLSYVDGVAVDASGNIYIADIENNRIRLVTKSTGFITTVAGNETAGFSGDGGLAISARFNNPYGVCLDALGNIYITDTVNNRVRIVGERVAITITY